MAVAAASAHDVLVGVWIGLVMVRLLDEVSIAAGVVLLVFSILLPLFCIALLLKTAFTDPGIIPRRTEPDEEFARTGKHTKRVQYNGNEVGNGNDSASWQWDPLAAMRM